MMLTVLLIGFGMMWLTLFTQTIGAVFWLKTLAKFLERRVDARDHIHLFRVIMFSSMVLLLIHVIQVLLWAFMYIALPGKAGLQDFHEAMYFSAVTFTTLGYGDVTIDSRWAMLSGAEAMVGIVAFGLTTALLFATIQKSWKVRHPDPKPQ